MTGRIVWGALASDAALRLALGRVPMGQDSALPDHTIVQDSATSLGLLAAWPDVSAAVRVVTGLTAAEVAMLDAIDTVLGADTAFAVGGMTGLRAGAHLPQAQAAMQVPGAVEPAGPNALGLTLIADILLWLADVPAQTLARRRGALAVAAASRMRAADLAPTALRHHARLADMQVDSLRHPYGAFFAIEERQTAWRRFDGTFSPSVLRAVFISGDAVTVLPYDPVRDRVLVVEQFRAGPQARGDAQPWSIEAIAGRIDPGEAPEHAARREAVEEAGLTLTDLRFVAQYYPSPGAVSEFIFSYLALTDLPDGAAGIFGREDEAEDIRGHLLGFDGLMDLVATGEINNAPLILTALWLQRERPRLRGAP